MIQSKCLTYMQFVIITWARFPPGFDTFILIFHRFIPALDKFIPASIPVTETLHLQAKYTKTNKIPMYQ